MHIGFCVFFLSCFMNKNYRAGGYQMCFPSYRLDSFDLIIIFGDIFII